MSRRNVGLSSLQRSLDASSSYSTLSDALSTAQTAVLSAQLSTFQTSLSNFSTAHRTAILSSPAFRTHFSQLCAQLGVDPLGGGKRGLWDKMGVGDWYYALGVQIVDVCLAGRERNGGLIALTTVIHLVTLLRTGGETMKSKEKSAVGKITEADVRRAIATLEPLGCGYEILSIGGAKVVRCTPGGMDQDSLVVVEAAASSGKGVVTVQEVWSFLRSGAREWSFERVERALEAGVAEGIVWIDEQGSAAGKEYWVPALFDFGT